MFANGGERVEPTLVDRVQDRYGKSVYKHDPRKCVECDAAILPAGTAPRITSTRDQVINPVTAYQITSMMEGVVLRGTAQGINLPVPVAGKTGTTNDAKDVWFIGYTSNIAAGCYIGYDNPRTLGGKASGGGLCGPVFETFMRTAIKKYGGAEFRVPPGGYFAKIDRFSGVRLPEDATGPNVISEYFREGQDSAFDGLLVDGGFGMGENLPLFTVGETDGGSAVTTSTGQTKVIPKKADFGTVSSGGLY
jgi:penicillin-binding protein 1A